MKTRLITSSIIAVSLLAFASGCGGKKDPVEACLDGDDEACGELFSDSGYYDDGYYYDDEGYYYDDEEEYSSLNLGETAPIDRSCLDIEFQNETYRDGQYDASKDECTWIGGEGTLTCPVQGGDCFKVDAP